MCSQCSQRVKNDVKLVLSMLRFGYTFGYTWLHLATHSYFIHISALWKSSYAACLCMNLVTS